MAAPPSCYRRAVLSRDVRFEGWTVESWLRLVSLLETEPHAAPRDDDPRGALFVIHDGQRVLKVLHSRVGRLDPLAEQWPTPLPVLAERHRASSVVAFHVGALEELAERWGARIARGDDVVAQAIIAAQVLRELALEGAFEAHPLNLRSLPVPSHAVVMRVLDALCPPGKVLLIGAFHDGDLHTAIAVRRGDVGIDTIVGPAELRPMMGHLSGDFRRDYRHLVAAAQQRLGPLSLGLFAEVETLQRLFHEGEPGAWARAIGIRDIVISPMNATALLPIAIDAIRGTVRAVRSIAERYDPTGQVAPLLEMFGRPEAERPVVLSWLRRLGRGDEAR